MAHYYYLRKQAANAILTFAIYSIAAVAVPCLVEAKNEIRNCASSEAGKYFIKSCCTLRREGTKL